MCGDEPETYTLTHNAVIVNPTCVGMNRIHTVFRFCLSRKPHMCGDEPLLSGQSNAHTGRKPHMCGDEPHGGIHIFHR